MRARNLDAAPLISAFGGLILVVSLFLHWYQPGLTAWKVFEVLDLVLAALGLATIAAGASELLTERPGRDRTFPVLGGAAFLIVASQLINHPPAAQGASVETGAWLALAGSALMAVGGALSAAGISLSLSLAKQPAVRDEPRGEPVPAAPRRTEPSPASEAAAVEPEVQDELYPEQDRSGPIGADDPEPWTAAPEDETLAFEPERDERT